MTADSLRWVGPLYWTELIELEEQKEKKTLAFDIGFVYLE